MFSKETTTNFVQCIDLCCESVSFNGYVHWQIWVLRCPEFAKLMGLNIWHLQIQWFSDVWGIPMSDPEKPESIASWSEGGRQVLHHPWRNLWSGSRRLVLQRRAAAWPSWESFEKSEGRIGHWEERHSWAVCFFFIKTTNNPKQHNSVYLLLQLPD